MLSDIHFLEFRKRPINQLVAICKDQHGLVLNHSMGTGKTLTGALFFANFKEPKFTHVVIAPQYMHAEWIQSIIKVGQTNPKKIHFVPILKDTIFQLADVHRNPSSFIVIVDEAHNIVKFLVDPTIDVDLKEKATSWFSKCKKILLLTGTPFSSSIEDISHLINLAAGKTVMPVTFQEFEDRYFKLKVTSSIIVGWGVPFTRQSLRLVNHFWRKEILVFSMTWMKYAIQNYNNQTIRSLINAKIVNPFSKEAIREDSPWTVKLVKYGSDVIETLLKMVDTMPKQVAFSIMLYLSIYALTKIQQTNDFMHLNVPNVVKDIIPYMSTYNPFINHDVDMLKHFPTLKEHVMYTNLNKEQMYFLYKFMTAKLSIEDIQQIGLAGNAKEMRYYRVSTTLEAYKDSGRMVSGSGKFPPKCAGIFRLHREKKELTLVYSNFETSILQFCKVARQQGFSTAMIPTDSCKEKERLLQEAQSGKIDFLCLPHYASEGIDMPGIRRFHILEPCLDITVYRQLIARVVRYLHTPVQYTVNVYTWVARMGLFPVQVVNFFRFWKKFGFHQVPWLFKDQIRQSESPEMLVINDLRRMSKVFDEIQKSTMHMAALARPSKDARCCIYNPIQPCAQESCLEYYEKQD
jgi:hypothetical protein